MPTTVTFAKIQAYLNAIINHPDTNPIENSPHQAFWNDVARDQFVNGVVPHVKCNTQPIPIIDKTSPLNSPFFLILTNSTGFCNKRQMPGGGPFITDQDYKVTLPDGTTVTGQQIQDDIHDWLSNGFPG